MVTARDEGFAPLTGAKVVVEVDNEGQRSTLEGQTGADGELVLPWPADRSGTHRLRAAVAVGEAPIGEADSVFAVTTRDPELDEVIPDTRFLEWLAGATGGTLRRPGDAAAMVLDPDADRIVNDRKETPLGRAPLLALVVATSAGLAWWVRRRAGLR